MGRDCVSFSPQIRPLFQSTRPRGTRPRMSAANAFGIVSIHAPTWDATNIVLVFTNLNRVSIHAPTWDATNQGYLAGKGVMFQSTRPRGTRQSTIPSFQARHSFNPRAHVGRDLASIFANGKVFVSIHAPTWDATVCLSYQRNGRFVSIHAPTWDATCYLFGAI